MRVGKDGKKRMSRKCEFLITIIANITLQVSTAVCGFILPPFVVRTFGSEVNGMVASISQFIACLNLVEAGIGGAAVASLYRPLAEGDTGRRNAILSAAAVFYRKSGCVFVFLVLLLALVYPLAVGGEVDRGQAGLMVLVLGITGAAEFFLIGKYRVLLTADRKVSVISAVQMLALLASTLLSVALIKVGCGIVMVKFASALVYMGRYCLLSLYVYKTYTGVNFHAAHDVDAVSQSKNVLVHQVCGFVVSYSPIIIVTLFCSLTEVSIYAIYAMIFSAIINFLNSFCTGMQNFFGELFVTDSLDVLREKFSSYETAFFILMCWFFGMTYQLVMPFIRLYTARMTDANYIHPSLGLFFIVRGILDCLKSPASQLINGAGHFKQTQGRSILEASINIVCSILFTIRMGFVGVVLGSICSYLYRSIDIICYAYRYILHTSPCRTFIKSIECLLYAAAFVRVASLFAVTIDSYTAWLLYACAFGTVFSIFLFLFAWRRR